MNHENDFNHSSIGGAEGGADELEIGEGSGGGGGGSSGRVKGPWAPEEDVMLSQIVAKFGARNWSLIARGIPGRSGKSCRLRWCNQLDPSVKRKPFTEEEDRIIIAAHKIHGNKWAAIARRLPGRTDNAIKNHWNSTLKRKSMDLGRFQSAPRESLEDGHLNRTKAISEEAVSVGNINSFKPPEEDVVMENISDQYEENAQTVEGHAEAEGNDTPTLCRPIARISAFSVYNPPSGSTTGFTYSTRDPGQGPFVQANKPEIGICNFLEDVGEPIVPSLCGHGCCAATNEVHSKNSLLGPEFVDYEEPSPFSSHQLISIATNLNSIAWIKSGLDNSITTVPENVASQRESASTALQTGIWEPSTSSDHLRFEEGRHKLIGMMKEVLSSQMPGHGVAMRTEVEGLS